MCRVGRSLTHWDRRCAETRHIVELGENFAHSVRPSPSYFDILLYAALGQAMLYVDGMNGVISHIGTIQWLYTLCTAKVGITVVSVRH